MLRTTGIRVRTIRTIRTIRIMMYSTDEERKNFQNRFHSSSLAARA